MQKVTLLDYPGKVACIIFTQGCPFACPYCHNSEIWDFKEKGTVTDDEVVAYLRKREKVIDGLVISGGEPALQKDLVPFLIRLRKELPRLLIKLDTTGCDFALLKRLIDERLVDYVAMDVKNVFPKYNVTLGRQVNVAEFQKSLELLKTAPIDVEFRTTIVKELHTKDDLVKIVATVGNKRPFYFQNFKDAAGVFDRSLHPFDERELDDILAEIRLKYPNVRVR